jgi:hypothetical protein
VLRNPHTYTPAAKVDAYSRAREKDPLKLRAGRAGSHSRRSPRLITEFRGRTRHVPGDVLRGPRHLVRGSPRGFAASSSPASRRRSAARREMRESRKYGVQMGLALGQRSRLSDKPRSPPPPLPTPSVVSSRYAARSARQRRRFTLTITIMAAVAVTLRLKVPAGITPRITPPSRASERASDRARAFVRNMTNNWRTRLVPFVATIIPAVCRETSARSHLYSSFLLPLLSLASLDRVPID